MASGAAIALEAAAWSLLWIALVALLVFKFPHLIAHDYPADIREAAHIPEPTEHQKKAGAVVMAAGWLILLGTLAAPAFIHYGAARVPFLTIFLHLWIMGFVWNAVDLLIVDWLIVCTIRPRCIVPAGTENCAGWKDYGFHFKGFLHGFVYLSLIPLVVAALSYAVLRFFVW